MDQIQLVSDVLIQAGDVSSNPVIVSIAVWWTL